MSTTVGLAGTTTETALGTARAWELRSSASRSGLCGSDWDSSWGRAGSRDNRGLGRRSRSLGRGGRVIRGNLDRLFELGSGRGRGFDRLCSLGGRRSRGRAVVGLGSLVAAAAAARPDSWSREGEVFEAAVDAEVGIVIGVLVGTRELNGVAGNAGASISDLDLHARNEVLGLVDVGAVNTLCLVSYPSPVLIAGQSLETASPGV